MSAGIMPDMYRHTARKSTVSKNIKPSNVSLSPTTNNNNNNSTIHYLTYHNDIDCKQQTKFDPIECNIKIEKQEESFIIIPDNEIEQMIIEEDNDNIIYDILEQIINQIIQSSSSSNTCIANLNQIRKSLSIDTQDVHNVIGSMMDHFNEIDDNNESLSTTVDNHNNTEENVNTSTNEIPSMEVDEQPSILSRSQADDDIVEIEATSSNDSSHLCTCECHKSISPLNNEYFLFEQALKQTRLEQQKEKSLTNNRLIQTLKRQHDELINIYQQNKNQKQISIKKIDREQQTIKFNLHDSQMQTDITTINNTNNSKLSLSQQKSLIIPTINSHNNNNNHESTSPKKFQGTLQTSTLQQIIPRLSANAIATTTVTNKTSTITTKTAIVTNTQATLPPQQPPPPPPLSSTVVSHDIVDLTEEDEDDNANRTPLQRATATRQSTSSIHSLVPSTVAPPTAARNRPVNRAIRPNSATTNGQTFPLRPLPENTPCDHTIARPQLSITQENATVRLTWNLQSTPMESIQNYEIYAYKQNATVTASDWKKIGTVKSMRLPMAVTLKEFQSNSHYAFAVRAVSITNNIGPFCEPKTIFTGSTPVQPLHTSQLLNVST